RGALMHQASSRRRWLLSRQVPLDLRIERREARSMPQQEVAPLDHARELHGHFRPELTGPEDDLVGDAFSECLEIGPAQRAGTLADQPLHLMRDDLFERVVVAMQLAGVQRFFIEMPAIAPFVSARYDERVGDEPGQRSLFEER